VIAEDWPDDPAGAALRHLSFRARQSNLARVAQLEAVLHRAGKGRLDAEDRDRAAEAAHQVVGSAGTFGYPQASALAARLEQLLLDSDPPAPGPWREAWATLAALRHELEGWPTGPDGEDTTAG